MALTPELEQKLQQRIDAGQATSQQIEDYNTLKRSNRLPSQVQKSQINEPNAEMPSNDTPNPFGQEAIAQGKGFAREVANQATLGFEPQIEGGVKAAGDVLYDKTIGDTEGRSIPQDYLKNYEQERNDVLRSQNKFEQDHPVESGIATIGGLALPTGEVEAAGKAGRAIFGALGETAGNIGKTVAENVALPAAQSVGFAESDAKGKQDLYPNEGYQDANIPAAAIGGATFGAGSAILGGVGVEKIANAIKAFSKSEENLNKRSLQKASAISGIKENDLEKRLNEVDRTKEDPEYRLVDTFGQNSPGIIKGLRSNIDAEKHNELAQEIENSRRNRESNIKKIVKDHLYDVEGLGKFSKDIYEPRDEDGNLIGEPKTLQTILQKERKQSTDPLYEEAYSYKDFYPSQEFRKELNDKEFQKYIESRDDIKGELERADTRLAKQSGSEYKSKKYDSNIRKAHDIVIGLRKERDAIEDKSHKDLPSLSESDKKDRLGAINKNRRFFLNELNTIPKFKEAQDLYADHSRARSILLDDGEILKNDPVIIENAMNSDPEKLALRRRAAYDIKESLNAGTDLTDFSKMFNRKDVRKNLSTIAKNPEEMMKKIDMEIRKGKTEDALLAGSNTAGNLAYGEQAKSAGMEGLPSSPRELISNLYAGALNKIIPNSREVHNRALDLMLEKSKPAQREILKNMIESIKKSKNKNKYEEEIIRLLRKGAAETAGKTVGQK